MRKTLILPLALALLASACDAAGLGLGVGTRCAADKLRVRQQHGPPDRVEEGVRSEIWQYFEENLVYEFAWDQEGENCVVTRRALLLPRVPLEP